MEKMTNKKPFIEPVASASDFYEWIENNADELGFGKAVSDFDFIDIKHSAVEYLHKHIIYATEQGCFPTFDDIPQKVKDFLYQCDHMKTELYSTYKETMRKTQFEERLKKLDKIFPILENIPYLCLNKIIKTYTNGNKTQTSRNQ